MSALLRRLPEPVKKPLRIVKRVAVLSSLGTLDPEKLPDLFHVYRSLHRHPDLERTPGGWVYRGRFYPDYLTVGGAAHAIFGEAGKFCRGEGLDVGAGLWPFPGATPVDVWRGPGIEHVISDFGDESVDYVFSSHCLEHIDDWRRALAEWTAKVKPGGVVFLYLPHPDCEIWHPGSPFIGDAHKWIPTLAAVSAALGDLDCEVVSAGEGPDAMQSFWVCGRKGARRDLGRAREPVAALAMR